MIPFTQYVLPNGRKVEGGFDRSAEVEQLAVELNAAGYRFEAEVLSTGVVSLDCSGPKLDDPEEDYQIAIELSPNNEAVVLDTVDRLVKRAHALVFGGQASTGEAACADSKGESE